VDVAGGVRQDGKVDEVGNDGIDSSGESAVTGNAIEVEKDVGSGSEQGALEHTAFHVPSEIRVAEIGREEV